MNDSEWEMRRREWADTIRVCGMYLSRDAADQVRLTASVIEFWRGKHIGDHFITSILRAACANLRYWQWQAWRGM